jgi:hypothetical protein
VGKKKEKWDEERRSFKEKISFAGDEKEKLCSKRYEWR